ncbi:MAG: glycosyltransferase [Chitinivibrionales bacterium]|nr:glycosyltransferase [Chitinivibrionales bacterium]
MPTADLAQLSKHSILCFSSSDWWAFNPYAINHTMKEFSKYTKVLFINTISPSIPSLKTQRKAFMTKLMRKLPSMLRFFRRPGKNLYVLTPLLIPIRKLSFLNDWVILLQVRLIMALFSFRNPLLWIANPSACRLMNRVGHSRSVYVCTDKWNVSEYASNRQALNDYDRTLSQRADLILCSSTEIFEHYAKNYPTKALYAPHAVNVDHFLSAVKNKAAAPADIAAIAKPIIGYFGSLTDTNDTDLLHYCALQRPQWSFVLIGKVMSQNYERLKTLPNVHFLGFKNYELLPRYGLEFSVCLLIWKMTEWIKFCNPLKTKEYLALGKPVVSVPIPEITAHFGDRIAIAETPEDFVRAIETQLQQDTPQKQQERIESVAADTWHAYIQRVVDALDKN